MTRLNNLCISALLIALLTACGERASETPVADTATESTTTTETVTDDAQVEPSEPEPVMSAVEESDGDYDPNAEAKEGALRIAQASPGAAPQRFNEGQHYKRLRPAKSTVGGGDDIEVAEVFWYGCNHCYNLEPTLRKWSAEKAEDTSFVKVPAMWNPTLETHGRAFYTIEALAGAGTLDNKDNVHMAFFDRIHVNRERLATESDIAEFLSAFGVSKQDFEATWSSPWVSLRMNQAKKLNKAYQIASVPTIVVNGKYVTGEDMAGSKTELVAVINELVASER